MKSFKDITLEQRTQMGQYYKDGLKASAIAPLYGTDSKTVNNVISFLRGNGVIIPFKIKPATKKPKPQELLVIPEEPKPAVNKAKTKEPLRKWTNGEKRQAYSLYKQSGVKLVMETFKTTEAKAYYIITEGRALNGVKGRRYNIVKRTATEAASPKVVNQPMDEILGGFFIGGVIGFAIAAVFL